MNDQRLFETEFARLQAGAGPLESLRQEAFDRFNELGWPTMRSEAYRYTNLRPIMEADLQLASGDVDVQLSDLESHLLEDQPVHRVVFVNGTFERLAVGHR